MITIVVFEFLRPRKSMIEATLVPTGIDSMVLVVTHSVAAGSTGAAERQSFPVFSGFGPPRTSFSMVVLPSYKATNISSRRSTLSWTLAGLSSERFVSMVLADREIWVERRVLSPRGMGAADAETIRSRAVAKRMA